MNNTFIDDKEKMRDFYELTKEEFLASYSYLTEEEYDATREVVNGFKNKYEEMYNFMLKCRDNFINQLKEGVREGKENGQ